MYIESIRLNNYIGVYNGMGKEEVFIQFNTRNKINLILGGNGSGKSTLMEALHPFSNGDRDKIITPNKKGFKEIVYCHDRLRYKIYHEYTPNKTGHNVKSYISRALNGEDFTELNPNGNVGSFEELVKQELCIDKLGMKLAKLSSTSNSIVGMTNAERKKYMNDIQPSLEIMSDLNKRMTEKYKDVKNQLARVSAKIDDIGVGGASIESLTLLDRRIVELETSKVNNINERANLLTKYKSYNMTIPELEESINRLLAEIRKYNIELDVIKNKKLKSNVELSNDEINEYIASSNERIRAIDNLLVPLAMELDVYNKQSNNAYLDLTNKERALANISSGESIDDCMKLIEDNKLELAKIDKYNAKLNTNFVNRVNSRYVLAAENALGGLSDKLEDLYAILEYGMKELEDCCNMSDIAIEQSYRDLMEGIVRYENMESISKSKLDNLDRIEKMTFVLKDRPTECTIDSCPFIKSATSVDISKLHEDIEAETKLLEDIQHKISINKDRLEYYAKLKNTKQVFNRLITQSIAVHESIKELPLDIVGILNNTEEFKTKVISGDFIIQHNLNELIEILGLDERAKYLTAKNDELMRTMSFLKEKDNMIVSYTDDIAKCKAIVDDMTIKISSTVSKVNELKYEKDTLLATIGSLHGHFDLNTSEKQYLDALKIAEESLSTARTTLPILNELKAKIIAMNNVIGNIDVELVNNKNKRDDVVYKVKSLESFKKEKAELEVRYQRVSLLKDMTSSTKGIPIVFTEIYIKETRRIANRLLNIILQDEYELMPFVIDDKTFRIPCKRGYDKINEDVGTMSAGEKAIVALVLSVALLIQCGTTYNILLLDEVDGPLDVEKKSKYIQVLESIMELLEIEQIMAISHSNEFDSYSTNIIALNGAEMNKINESDIIFKL